MKTPFWMRIALWFSGVILVGTVAISVAEYQRQRELLEKSYRVQAETIAATITPVFLEPLLRGYVPSQDHYRNVLTRITRANEDLRLIRVLDDEGKPIGVDPGKKDTIDAAHHLLIMRPIELHPEGFKARAIGWLELHFDSSRLDDLIATQFQRSVQNAAALIALSLVAAMVISRLVTVPLGRLSSAMAKLRVGDLSVHVPVTSKDEIGELTTSFNEAVAGLRVKKELGKYVSSGALEAAERRAGGDKVEGELRELTLLFSDIIGFTSYSESNQAKTVVESLNNYFDEMVAIVVEHGGSLDKLIGDALMAVFASPDPALHAAIAMQIRLDEMRKNGRTIFHTKVGINTGDVIQGDIGSITGRRDNTCIGDPVNVASRLCYACPPDQVHLGSRSWELLKEKPAAEKRTGLKVKGVERDLETYVVATDRI